MAKVALLSKRLTPQALGLAQALQFHRHEVMMITSAQETVPDSLGFQVLTYFKTWSFLEALKFFPRVLGQAPEVWHFVFSDFEKENPTPAHWVLSQLARALPGRVVAASFYDSFLSVSRRQAVPLLKNCDIVTTATRENLMYLKRKSWLNRFCETEVLPPFLEPGTSSSEMILDQDLKQLVDAARPFLLLPSQRLAPDVDWDLVLGRFQLIICGDRPERSLPKTYYVGPHLSDGSFLELLKGSAGLLTAFDDFSIVELLRFQRLCALAQTPAIANPRQAEALPGFCVHKRSGFQVSSMTSLHQLISENPKLELQSPLFESIKMDLADSALNELNRLYAKVRHAKTSSVDFKRGPLP
ncbi:MAG: hypothetical protein ACAH59_09260 [Pseudobdellovibrionaceae bacterium]